VEDKDLYVLYPDELQNTQSNQHLAGLVILAAMWLETNNLSRAALAIALAFLPIVRI